MFSTNNSCIVLGKHPLALAAYTRSACKCLRLPSINNPPTFIHEMPLSAPYSHLRLFCHRLIQKLKLQNYWFTTENGQCQRHTQTYRIESHRNDCCNVHKLTNKTTCNKTMQCVIPQQLWMGMVTQKTSQSHRINCQRRAVGTWTEIVACSI